MCSRPIQDKHHTSLQKGHLANHEPLLLSHASAAGPFTRLWSRTKLSFGNKRDAFVDQLGRVVIGPRLAHVESFCSWCA